MCPHCGQPVMTSARSCGICHHSLRPQIGLALWAALAAAAVPALWNLSLVVGVEHSAYLFLYFLLGLTALLFGFAAALLCGKRFMVAFLALPFVAGLAEAAIESVLSSTTDLMFGGEDALSWVATGMLFAAGAASAGTRGQGTSLLKTLKVGVGLLGLVLSLIHAVPHQAPNSTEGAAVNKRHAELVGATSQTAFAAHPAVGRAGQQLDVAGAPQ